MRTTGPISMLPNQTEIKKIAVIRRNGLGDLLCAVPTITYLRQLYPEAEITLFADERNAALLPYLSCYDKAVIFKSGNKYLEVLSTAWKYRKEKFDLAISLKPTPMKLVNLFLGLLRSKYQIAASEGEWHGRWLSHPRPVLSKEIKTHQALKCLRLLHPDLEEIPPHLLTKITLNPRSSELAHLPNRYCITSLSNNRSHNQLPTERHARLLNTFSSRYEIPIVLSCMPSDRPKAEAVLSLLRCPAKLHVSDTLSSFLQVLGHSSLAFSSDGGFMHMAAALDCPQVALFTTTLPTEWAPMSDKCTYLHEPAGLEEIEDSQILTALADRLSS